MSRDTCHGRRFEGCPRARSWSRLHAFVDFWRELPTFLEILYKIDFLVEVGRVVWDSRAVCLIDTMCLLMRFRKSTTPQSRQLNTLISNSKQ